MIQDIKTQTGKTEGQSPATKPKKPVPSPVTDAFKRGVYLVDANVMPILAWIALVGLSVRGSMTLLAHMSSDIQLGIAIAIVAFLAFKLR